MTWLATAATHARRIASVSTGAYFLAEAKLLENRRATTHWRTSDDFARKYPNVHVDADRIFIHDGPIWTSAGITAGIDLALALIEADLGFAVAQGVAQNLVVHHRRPGGQSQFSALHDLSGRSGQFAKLLDWVRQNLSEPLTVEQLADRVAMSPRNFARAFTVETNTTPAKAVERLRLEAARTALETTQDHIEHIAKVTGFGDTERMRRAFVRAFGQPPQALRRETRT
ncbi:GlxA family transcriptional regulator [Sphaerotilaceae bacterium SBD11-9]